MAGDWIPAQVDLPRKREVLMIARQTGRSRHEVVGLLIDFWGWASNETTDGTLLGLALDDLVQIIGADGTFWDAVVQVGWIVPKTYQNRTSLIIPNADHWITSGAKARIKETERKRAYREKRPDSVPVLSQNKRDESGTTEEKRIEENTNTPLTPLRGEWDDSQDAEKHEVEVAEKRRDDKGEPDFTAGFLRFWTLWPSHQRKQGKSKCAKHWKRKGLENITEEVISALKRSKANEFSKDGGKFVPFPQTWLNRTPWETDASEMEESSGDYESNGFKPRDLTPEDEIFLFGKVVSA